MQSAGLRSRCAVAKPQEMGPARGVAAGIQWHAALHAPVHFLLVPCSFLDGCSMHIAPAARQGLQAYLGVIQFLPSFHTHAEQLALFPSQVLTSQPDNSKAIFRRGRAQLRMGNTDAAERDLTRAAALSPADAAIMRVRPDRGSCCCRAVTYSSSRCGNTRRSQETGALRNSSSTT